MDKNKYLDYLIEEKKRWENLVAHAIQNEFNPFTDNGTERLKKTRIELERITKEVEQLVMVPKNQ